MERFHGGIDSTANMLTIVRFLSTNLQLFEKGARRTRTPDDLRECRQGSQGRAVAAGLIHDGTRTACRAFTANGQLRGERNEDPDHRYTFEGLDGAGRSPLADT